MQDRFVGDIGDFGKYGLLRALTGIWPEAEPHLSLGVMWYRNAEESSKPRSPAKDAGYLDKPDRFRDCDPVLFDVLSEIVTSGERNLCVLERSGVLGETAFHGQTVPKDADARKQWANRALKAVGDSTVVFVDPDVGLAPATAENSPAHARLAEIKPVVERAQTLVIYQSFGRNEEHPEQMARWMESLPQAFSFEGIIRILRFRPYNPRAFIILPAAEHAEIIDARLKKMLDGPWGQHFTRYTGD